MSQPKMSDAQIQMVAAMTGAMLPALLKSMSGHDPPGPPDPPPGPQNPPPGPPDPPSATSASLVNPMVDHLDSPPHSQPQQDYDDVILDFPISSGVHRALTLGEAHQILLNPTHRVKDPKTLWRAPGGTIWYYHPSSIDMAEDYKSDGHHFRLTSGASKIKNEKFQDIERVKATIMVRGQSGAPERSRGFQKITWRFKSRDLGILIQYIGDESLSKPQVHGNSKKNKDPWVASQPSLFRRAEISTMKGAAFTEAVQRQAGPTVASQVWERV